MAKAVSSQDGLFLVRDRLVQADALVVEARRKGSRRATH